MTQKAVPAPLEMPCDLEPDIDDVHTLYAKVRETGDGFFVSLDTAEDVPFIGAASCRALSKWLDKAADFMDPPKPIEDQIAGEWAGAWAENLIAQVQNEKAAKHQDRLFAAFCAHLVENTKERALDAARRSLEYFENNAPRQKQKEPAK